MNPTTSKSVVRWTSKLLSIKSKIFSSFIKYTFRKYGREINIELPVKIWGCHNIEIGDQVHIGPNSWIHALEGYCDERSTKIIIGNKSRFSGDITISAANRIHIGNSVLVGRFVHISDHSHAYSDTNIPISEQGITNISPVTICEGVWIGQGAIICPGVTIGKNSVIGANSLVKTDIPPFTLAAGTPARPIKSLERERE